MEKFWTGTVTFTASKPYNPKVIPDARHGAPYNAKWIRPLLFPL
ncbi:MAG TPA: hypothetical protein VFJ51_14580 [Nitrososphaeraceae archaeon]|nr:hypothetical protein [Nitrososphaeraceae archaeon]